MSQNSVLGRCVEHDEEGMQLALEQARYAYKAGEVPVGAVVVSEGVVIGVGFNQPISTLDPSAHAEVVAVRDAAQRIGNYRLPGATLYVTVEPCTMCTGLLIHSRIARVVYGASEPKAGAMHSALQLPQQPCFNHQLLVTGGILADSCAELMSSFFAMRRAGKKRLQQGRDVGHIERG
ncbi:MAG: tRNA adenosine(34) deaminase TadA [Bacterioplanes sp.]|nr:tRNA adenosine(34) deaminase TadA [Bacterioplanes sp.]